MTKWLKTRVKEWLFKKIKEKGDFTFAISDISMDLRADYSKVRDVIYQLEKERFVEKRKWE